MKLITLPLAFYEGSVKTLHDMGDGTLAYRYKGGNLWSAFDVGPHHQPIPGSDLAVCAAAVHAFKVAAAMGINTHFIEQLDDLTILIKKFELVKDRFLQRNERGVFLPLEFITRWYVSGRRWREFHGETKLPMAYGFSTNDLPDEGTAFPYPCHEWTTKWSPEDVEVTEAVARKMSAITIAEMHHIWAILDTLNGALNAVLAQVGLTRLDCKNEVGRDENGQFTVLDVFCTQHEDRIVRIADLKQGIIDHLSKEKPRQELIRLGFKKRLDAARAAKQPLPSYPDMDEDFLAKVGKEWDEVTELIKSVPIAA